MITPRPYLSWTQLNLWEKDPEGYREQYIRGHPRPITNAMRLGSEVATSMETEEETGDPLKDLVISMIPKFDNREVEIAAPIKIARIEIPLLGKLDSARQDLMAFKEVKTGSVKWTQRRADEHGQITFYATIIREITNRIPDDIELIWAETQMDHNYNPHLTGKIVVFKTKRTLADIVKMKARIKKAWFQISQMMEEELGII